MPVLVESFNVYCVCNVVESSVFPDVTVAVGLGAGFLAGGFFFYTL